MNPVEQAGKITLSFMDSMKTQPLALALVVLSFALIGLLYFQSVQFTTQRKENVALFVQVQTDVQKLLSQCIVPAPPPRAEFKLQSEELPPVNGP